jgi:D-3-phosphoglycerate dehydrogenase
LTAVKFPEASLPPHRSSHRRPHFQTNVPAVFSRIETVFSGSGANIVVQYPESIREFGDLVIRLSAEHGRAALAARQEVERTLGTRALACLL